MRERVVNGHDNIVRRGYARRTRVGVYCIWKETKKWDSLAFGMRPVRATLFRVQYLFPSDCEHCVRGIAVCYPMVMSPTRIVRHVSTQVDIRLPCCCAGTQVSVTAHTGRETTQEVLDWASFTSAMMTPAQKAVGPILLDRSDHLLTLSTSPFVIWTLAAL
jgi:hypothetical protein